MLLLFITAIIIIRTILAIKNIIVITRNISTMFIILVIVVLMTGNTVSCLIGTVFLSYVSSDRLSLFSEEPKLSEPRRQAVAVGPRERYHTVT